VNIINSYARGYLVRRLMRTERVITLKKIYKEALQYMLKLHVDAPLNLAEVNFLHRLQLQVIAKFYNARRLHFFLIPFKDFSSSNSNNNFTSLHLTSVTQRL
jgi:hypothetical protein